MNTTSRTDPATAMTEEDYQEPAEIFISKGLGRKRNALGYHRFATAAEAIEFAVEEFSSLGSEGLVMTVADKRFNLEALRTLYNRAEGDQPDDPTDEPSAEPSDPQPESDSGTAG